VRGRFRKTKRVLFHLLVRSLQLLARHLPRRVALSVFAALSEVVRLLDRPAIRRSLANLEIAYGTTLGPAARARIVRGMFRETARNLVDVLRPFPRERRRVDELVRFEGLANLEAALRERRGVIALSAHLGNWEVLGAALAARGFAVHAVAREIFDRRSDRLLNDWRTQAGVRLGGSLVALRRALRDGGIVGMLVDQDMPGPSVFAEFFGRPARTPRAPFALARRTGAPLVPRWIHLGPDGRHVATILPALALAPGTDEAAILADVRAWHLRLETAISAHPEQWVWHHRRWRSAPLAEPLGSSPRLTDVVPQHASREVALTR